MRVAAREGLGQGDGHLLTQLLALAGARAARAPAAEQPIQEAVVAPAAEDVAQAAEGPALAAELEADAPGPPGPARA